MEVLKMIADWCYGEKPEGTRVYDDIPKDERDNNSWWYLHGELENIVHYDKATVTNCKSGGFGQLTINYKTIIGDDVKDIREEKPFIYKMCFNGIVDVEIEGIDKLCKGYFWTTNHRYVYWKGKSYRLWDQRGLVVLSTDFESNEYAMKKYIEKTSHL